MPQFEFPLPQPVFNARLKNYHLGNGEISNGKFKLQRDILQTLSVLHTSEQGASVLELLQHWPPVLDADEFRLLINRL